MAARPTAYEGKEKYIFISYAHSDRDRVYKILSEFEKRGYRFWYDDGITPGAEWAEDIAEHLSGAYVVMAFITNASAASDNCRREITYALSKRKPFVSVLLEPTEMSAGLELQLSAHQSVIRDNFPSAEGFFNKLLSNPDVELCKAVGTEETVEAVAEESSSADNGKFDKFYRQYRKNKEFQKKLDEEYEKLKQGVGLAAAATETVSAAKEPISNAGPAKKKPNKKLFVLIGAVLLAAGILFALLNVPYKATWGESYKDTTDLTIEGETLQQEDIDAFAKFKNLEMLSLKKCDLTGCDLTAFGEKEDLFSVELDDCTGIFSYDFLNNDNIRYVTVTNCDTFSDLSVINPENITELNVSGSPVSDISVLNQAQKITLLDISNTEVSDISALSGNTSLRELNISGSSVKSADAVMSCPDLKTLDASNCKLADFSKQCVSLELKELYLSNSGISDLSAFSDCATIETLILNDNKDLTDMSWLSKYSQSTLKALDLSRTGLDAEGLSILERCPMIEDLTIDELDLGNLDFCISLASLTRLSAQGCGLTDIKGISRSTMLEEIFLGFNKIADVSPLHDLRVPASGDRSIYLDLSYNKLSDVSALPEGKYYTLILCGNDKSVAGSINEGSEIYTLCADWYDGFNDEAFLKTEGIRLFLVGVPQSEQVATEDALSSKHSFNMITADTLYNDLMIRPTNENDFNTYSMKISDMEETSKLYNKYVK